LRVGLNVWPGHEPFLLARSLGYYDGQPIRLVDFPSSVEVIRAYRNGAIDAAALTADEALLVAESQPNQRIVLVIDFSKGADAILARPPFASMTDLKGRRIGLEPGALGALMLARALELAKMSASEVTAVPVPLAEHESAYASGQVDAVVTFEPRRSRLLAAGARQVFDSSQIPGEVVDVLLARGEWAETDMAALTGLVQGWFRALDYLKRNPADAGRRMAPREQVRPEAFLKSLEGLALPDRAANLNMLGPPTTNLVRPLRRLAAVMTQNKLLSRPVDPATLPDDRAVRQGTR
jgi:NitT/TauT family transport system substrate-binding protein